MGPVSWPGAEAELLPQEGAQVTVQPWPSTEGPCLSLALPAGNWLPSRQLLLGMETCEGSWDRQGSPAVPGSPTLLPKLRGHRPSDPSFSRFAVSMGRALGVEVPCNAGLLSQLE